MFVHVCMGTNISITALYMEMLTTAIQDSVSLSLGQKQIKTIKINTQHGEQQSFLLLMFLQRGTHVQHNRNPATMHNVTISQMQLHKETK